MIHACKCLCCLCECTQTRKHARTHAESCVHEVLASSCHIEAAEEREAFLRALLEEHAEAADGWRELIQWNCGVDESLRMAALPKSE